MSVVKLGYVNKRLTTEFRGAGEKWEIKEDNMFCREELSLLQVQGGQQEKVEKWGHSGSMTFDNLFSLMI